VQLTTVRCGLKVSLSSSRRIFDYIGEREELVSEPFQRLVKQRQLIGYQYDGFCASMDAFKDKQPAREPLHEW